MQQEFNLPLVLDRINRFVEERDWDQFHTPKNLAMALAAESGELLEIFQWLTEEQSLKIKENPEEKSRVGEELADVLTYLLRLAHKLEIPLEETVLKKIQQNALKYPVEKARGVAKKYHQL